VKKKVWKGTSRFERAGGKARCQAESGVSAGKKGGASYKISKRKSHLSK